VPELASAGGDRYVVFDLECDADPVPAGCEARGIRWSQPSQDHSSNVTGSSIFDFEGDGAADAVYADECFLRVYDGATGVVKFSQARSSGTTYENPVVADVDGDFNTEIVTCTNDYAGTLGCAAEDPLFAGAMFETSHGVRVFADAEDRWVGSRPVWNQHAYAVTGVGDRGEIRDLRLGGTDPPAQQLGRTSGHAQPNAGPDLMARGQGFDATAARAPTCASAAGAGLQPGYRFSCGARGRRSHHRTSPGARRPTAPVRDGRRPICLACHCGDRLER
jgi:hypothetical protein